jgi:hypothetical protein
MAGGWRERGTAEVGSFEEKIKGKKLCATVLF